MIYCFSPMIILVCLESSSFVVNLLFDVRLWYGARLGGITDSTLFSQFVCLFIAP